MDTGCKVIRRILLIPGFMMVLGCAATFNPRPMEEIHFMDRAQTKSDGNFRVIAAVLSAEETEAVFALPLYRKGIQPIWLEIANNNDRPTWFLPFSVDPDYFSPLEVTYPYHRTFQKEYNRQLDQYFKANEMRLFIAPGTTRSGFVFTNLDLGTKIFNVDLVGDDNQPKTFTFFISVPGLRVDHQDVEFEKLYAADKLVSYNLTDLRNALDKLPCCTTKVDSTKPGAPVNLVIVGTGEDLLRILISSGWDETASTDQPSSSQQLQHIDTAQIYRYQSVSTLYYYGRTQDASFRIIRTEGLGGKVLRLWLSPMRLEGKPVWIGQVSKDLGQPTFSFKDHIIDLDEDRSFFLQNLWYFQGIEKYAYVKGTAASTLSQLKQISGGIAYISDGYRAVLWMSEEPIPLNAVEFMDWEIPPGR
jgi:hypothetical protein